MNSPVYVIQKAGGEYYNHVTFVIQCADGFYEFGFYGKGKFGDISVTVDKYSTLPEHREASNAGLSNKSLQQLIDQAKSWSEVNYNLLITNCGDFTKMMCEFSGTQYPTGAVFNL